MKILKQVEFESARRVKNHKAHSFFVAKVKSKFFTNGFKSF